MLHRHPRLRLESLVTMTRTIAPVLLLFGLTAMAPGMAAFAAEAAPAKATAKIAQLNFAGRLKKRGVLCLKR